MGITKILRRTWLFSANKIKSSESFSTTNSTHRQTQLIIAAHNCHTKLKSKGQLILKCLFGVFNFLQKTNENKSNSSKIEFVHSFFGGNVGLKKSFWFSLTFSCKKSWSLGKSSLVGTKSGIFLQCALVRGSCSVVVN